MYCFRARVAWALTLFVLFSTAIPSLAVVTSLAPRSQVCANSPKTVAGTLFTPRRLSANALKSPRFVPLDRQKVVWCAIRSSTFVIISATQTIPGNAVYDLLVDAALDQLRVVNEVGDRLIRSGTYDRLGRDNTALHIWNTNNHQLTSGVLAAALDALADFVDSYWGGALQFYIWDGRNEVAQGLLGLSG